MSEAAQVGGCGLESVYECILESPAAQVCSFRRSRPLHGRAAVSGGGKRPGNMVKYAREPENATKSCKVLSLPMQSEMPGLAMREERLQLRVNISDPAVLRPDTAA